MGPRRARSLSAEGQSLYRELGVARGASPAEIRAAYRRLALQHHPDKHAGSAAATARFQALNRAHAVLSDPRQRRLYDRHGSRGLRAAAGLGPGGAALLCALASPAGRALLLLCALLTGGCCAFGCCCGCCCDCCCHGCCGACPPRGAPAEPEEREGGAPSHCPPVSRQPAGSAAPEPGA